MGKYTITSEDVASTIQTECEGRLEVMEDDGLSGAPDHEDLTAVLTVLGEKAPYPQTIELSDAETQQLAITIENLLDWVDPDDQDDPATVPAIKDLQQVLKGEGYPR